MAAITGVVVADAEQLDQRRGGLLVADRPEGDDDLLVGGLVLAVVGAEVDRAQQRLDRRRISSASPRMRASRRGPRHLSRSRAPSGASAGTPGSSSCSSEILDHPDLVLLPLRAGDRLLPVLGRVGIAFAARDEQRATSTAKREENAIHLCPRRRRIDAGSYSQNPLASRAPLRHFEAWRLDCLHGNPAVRGRFARGLSRAGRGGGGGHPAGQAARPRAGGQLLAGQSAGAREGVCRCCSR